MNTRASLVRAVREYDMHLAEVDGNGFRHLLIWNRPAQNQTSISRLHLYIGGDGIPWVAGGTLIAVDPSPYRVLTLELMSADRRPAVYLGRPCYFLKLQAGECTPHDWTFGRYSEPVVASMAAAIQATVDRFQPRSVVLVGYSGGGALAALLVERLEKVVGLVTIAGNLNTDQWTHIHRYEPLHGSLNPQKSAKIPEGLLQLHLAGELDSNVPPIIAEQFALAHEGTYESFQGFDHDCCWQQGWPQVLERLESLLP